MHLALGQTTKGEPLALPLDIATETLAVFGRRGSGKTNTATVVVEELLAGNVQVVVLDPKGEWWGLGACGDGQPSRHPVTILGGTRGDLPLDERDGPTLADFVAENPGESIVLSMRHFESDAACRRFTCDFARRLYFRKGESDKQTPLMVVVEEAHLYVAQRVDAGSAAMVGAIQKLVRQGRAFGLGVMLVDQRPATVNKDVLTQAGLLIVHHVAGPQDRKALQDWIDAHDSGNHAREFHDTLAGLQRGECWVWGGDRDLFVRATIRHRHTYDSSATPKPGERRAAAPEKRKPADLEALRAKLAKTIEQARENDPDALRNRIRELERELKRKSPAAVQQLDPEPMIRSRVAAEIKTRDRQWRQAVADMRSRLRGLVAGLDVAEPPVAPERDATPPQIEKTHTRTTVISDATFHATSARSGASEPRGGMRRMLIALAQYLDGLTETKLSLLSGISRNGGTWSQYRARLVRDGLIERGGPGLKITPAGLKEIGGHYTPLPTGPALRQYWLQQMGGGKARMLDALLGAYPRWMSAEEVGKATDIEVAGGTFSQYRAYLRRLELIKVRNGEMCAANELFEE